MTQIGKFFILSAYGISVVFLPWWVSVFLGVILLAVYRAYFSVIGGAFLLDIAFGGPLAAFAGFSYLYTFIFIGLALVSFMLSRMMIE